MLLFTGEEGADIEGIKAGKYRYVFGAPESFLGQHRQLLLHQTLQENTCLLVIDESHCVKKL